MDQMFNLGKWGELFGSVIIDIIGLASYLVPGLGEASDLATAPLNWWWVMEMYNDPETSDDAPAELLSAFSGLEELAPFLDIIPSAMIAWFFKYRFYTK